jgi:hypothetical protein
VVGKWVGNERCSNADCNLRALTVHYLTHRAAEKTPKAGGDTSLIELIPRCRINFLKKRSNAFFFPSPLSFETIHDANELSPSLNSAPSRSFSTLLTNRKIKWKRTEIYRARHVVIWHPPVSSARPARPTRSSPRPCKPPRGRRCR